MGTSCWITETNSTVGAGGGEGALAPLVHPFSNRAHVRLNAQNTRSGASRLAACDKRESASASSSGVPLDKSRQHLRRLLMKTSGTRDWSRVPSPIAIRATYRTTRYAAA